MPRYGNEANLSCFLTCQTLKCSIPRMFEQNVADLFGVSMYYCLTYLKSFIVLAQCILMLRTQVQYPLFATFQKIGYFWTQIKVA